MGSRRRTPDEFFKEFQVQYKLTDVQREQFRTYYEYLIAANKKLNLTAITSLKGVLNYHFADSLILSKFTDLRKIKSMADVGAGAGFPALPLKIVYPHLRVVLIEVTRKKQEFLRILVDLLGLKDVEVCGLDWRTFLRTTTGQIDLFVSRATLNEIEQCRLFRHTSSYRNATMVYWASDVWKPATKALNYIKRVEKYHVHRKDRKLVFMSLPSPLD